MVTGVLSYFREYSRVLASIHTVFGLLFSIGIIFHISNNFKPLKSYSAEKAFILISGIVGIIFASAYFQKEPILSFMDFGAKLKANSQKSLNQSTYEIMDMGVSKDINLSIDLQRAEHYWHPQMAVWIEDSLGNYQETIFISKATAQGLFFGGRSKNNFKEFDQKKEGQGDYRRVDALPVWSHKRNVMYEDGYFVPPSDQPLPDAITGATLIDNFKLLSSIDSISHFNLMIELNVAFDDNEYYSEYDFPDDDTYHNGTGQLGQPSIIYHSSIDMNDDEDYYLMKLIGHGHRSGPDW